MAMETLQIYGAEYERNTDWDVFYYIKGYSEHFPGIVCTCHSSEFWLRYGNYELIAKCVNCDTEGSVYSG